MWRIQEENRNADDLFGGPLDHFDGAPLLYFSSHTIPLDRAWSALDPDVNTRKEPTTKILGYGLSRPARIVTTRDLYTPRGPGHQQILILIRAKRFVVNGDVRGVIVHL